jgi:hypoxanthine phosphoribosyltransferase
MKITAKQIKGDYEGKIITIVAIMKGAITVTADLMREFGLLNVPCTLQCISTSSYGKNGTNRGELVIKGIESIEIEGKDVLLVDDAFDSGATMAGLIERFQQLNPRSLRSMVAVVKDVARKTTYYPEYVLFEIPNYFIVGYGLDCSEHFRQLPDIRYLKDSCTPECLK